MEDTQSIRDFMALYFSARKEMRRSWIEEMRSLQRHSLSDAFLAFSDILDNEDWLYEDSHPPIVLLHTWYDNNTAKVITIEPTMDSLERYCYTLNQTESGWRIDRIASECSLCERLGCSLCEGTGWRTNDYYA